MRKPPILSPTNIGEIHRKIKGRRGLYRSGLSPKLGSPRAEKLKKSDWKSTQIGDSWVPTPISSSGQERIAGTLPFKAKK